MPNELIDKWSYAILIATLIFSWFLFWSYSSEIFLSFLAAVIAAGMAWLAYFVLRMIFFAFRN